MNSFFADYSDFANIGLQKKDLVFYELTDSTNTRAREAFLEYGKNARRYSLQGGRAPEEERGREALNRKREDFTFPFFTRYPRASTIRRV